MTVKALVFAPPFDLATARLGPLPIVNHFIRRLGLEKILEKHVPTGDPRVTLSYAKGLGVLIRSIIVEREPIYRQQEMVGSFLPAAFGIEPEEVKLLSDDRVGRALDQLFDADRAALLTDVVIQAGKRFGLRFSRLHNDSTTIRFAGQYRDAKGRSIRGRRAPWITYGHSKDHRPDLKQLLFILTANADGGVPVQFRCEDGNANDSTTHIESWEALRRVAGRSDFLYVGDSKLCGDETMRYITARKGRLVTVLPRNRGEDALFRKWIQTNEPDWEQVWDRPNPRRKYGPRDKWWVCRYHLPSQEGWPVVWVYSALLRLRQKHRRQERIAGAEERLLELKQKLASPKTRLRKAAKVDQKIEAILGHFRVARYLKVKRVVREEHRYRQHSAGRPGPKTSYRRLTRRRWDIVWVLDQEAVDYDHKSDGMYPLLTNDKKLTSAQVLEAHKGQPGIEERFRQTKSVHQIAPVFLHNEDRIAALFFLYFLALMVQGLIERQVRRGMNKERIKELALYPEERASKKPTTEQVLRLFAGVQGHVLSWRGKFVQAFEAELTPMQKTLLRLLGMPASYYRVARSS